MTAEAGAPSRLRIAYLLGRAPQPESTFTNDEILALRSRVNLAPVGLIGTGARGDWKLAPPLRSVAAWQSVGHWLIRRPLALIAGFAALVLPSLTRPRDAATAVRAGIAACSLARGLSVDVIHAQFAGPAGAGAYLWHRLTGRPYTVRAHAYDIYRPYRWAGVVLRGAAAVLAISDHAARHIRSTWGVEARVVRVGVSPDAVAIRDRTSPSRPFRVISVGALEPKKGHDLLIRAVGQLIRNGVAVTLDIHGEGSMRRELTNLAEGLPVHLLGWQDPLELRSCLRQYDAFALGARVAPDGDTDGIPVVLMEASLAGLPVVTTNVGGIPELIEHDVTGWARSPTVDDLADGIAMALSDYPAALDRASVAKQRVRERHDGDGQAGRLLETWAALVEHRS